MISHQEYSSHTHAHKYIYTLKSYTLYVGTTLMSIRDDYAACSTVAAWGFDSYSFTSFRMIHENLIEYGILK